MNKYKEIIDNILNKIRGNKRILYLTFCTVLILFCLALNITFAKYTRRNNLSSANIIIGKLKYKMQVNNGALEDRILRISKNSTLTYDIVITSLNNFDTKYELTYEVCSNQNCTSTITMPTDLEIRKLSTTSNDITGSINSNNFITITIAGINGNATTDYYIKLGLNAGYSHNELALTNQINKTFYNDDVTIIAYVDGKETSSFPTSNKYIVSGECKVGGAVDSDITVAGVWNWNDSKWNITISKVSESNTICNVNFEEAPLLAAAIMKNYPTIETPRTTPGSAVSTSDEALLAATEDDYGTSYYFRGAVKNNYVEFANKCWRIVRITGNGAIKLVLHNDNVNNATSPCDAINNDANASFARYDGTTYVSKFNVSRDKNAYVGFMYGTPGSSTYALEHENKNDSTILTNLKKWYDLTFNKEQKSKLADVIWCNDKNVLTDTSYNPWNMSIGLNFGVGTNKNYYSAASRIISSNNSAGGFGPTLVCSIDNLGGNLSKYTAEDVVNGNGTLKGYKVGLLTADEMVFAGGSLKLSNSSYYLYENASDTLWWTLSPWAYDGVSLYLFTSFPDGSLDGSYANTEFGVRPSIALIPSIQISGGTGTSSDPFIIIEN